MTTGSVCDNNLTAASCLLCLVKIHAMMMMDATSDKVNSSDNTITTASDELAQSSDCSSPSS